MTEDEALAIGQHIGELLRTTPSGAGGGLSVLQSQKLDEILALVKTGSYDASSANSQEIPATISSADRTTNTIKSSTFQKVDLTKVNFQVEFVQQQGLNRNQAGFLRAINHINQSIGDIVNTLIGTRVERREYGSHVPALVDSGLTPINILRIYEAATVAIDRWEVRINVRKVFIDTANVTSGHVTLNIAWVIRKKYRWILREIKENEVIESFIKIQVIS